VTTSETTSARTAYGKDTVLITSGN